MNSHLIIKTAFKFYGLGNAINFIANADRPGKWSIIMGDDEKFWVVTNREAAILINRGYELAQ